MLRIYLKLIQYLFVFAYCLPVHAGSYDDFFRAVNVDDAATVTALLVRGFDPNAPSEKGHGALFLALRAGSGKVVAALLVHPALRVDEPNASGETPLMMAALRGNVEAAQWLLDRGAQINRPGWAPLHYAACSGEPALAAFLLDRGAAIEAPSPNRTTPLMMAARYGSENAALLMLARGASPRARNDQGLDAAAFARLAAREALAQRLELAAR